ncbi:hypothetical protein MHYP_G00119800 [Metynnis hypsauchen]
MTDRPRSKPRLFRAAIGCNNLFEPVHDLLANQRTGGGATIIRFYPIPVQKLRAHQPIPAQDVERWYPIPAQEAGHKRPVPAQEGGRSANTGGECNPPRFRRAEADSGSQTGCGEADRARTHARSALSA